MMYYKKIAKPCENFSAQTAFRIVDPKDSREKVAFVSIAQSSRGMLVIADFENKEYESHYLPADNGAWGVLQLKDGSLLLGTCNCQGLFLRFDLKNRTWYEPLNVSDDTYIYGFVLGSDGKAYGGSYPGDRLFRYDPDTHTVENLGKVSDEPDNESSRFFYNQIDGKIIVFSRFATKRITYYDIATGTFDRTLIKKPGDVFWITDRYLCHTNDVELEFFDPRTGKPLLDRTFPVDDWQSYADAYELVADMKKAYNEQPQIVLEKLLGKQATFTAVCMSNGDIWGVIGQEMLRLKKGSTEIEYQDIECAPPKTFIHELIAGEDGKLWGSSSLGMTLFCYDPKTGRAENTKSVSMHGGEVYGMVSSQGKIYCTAYSGGEHIVYDLNQPWQCREKINPRPVCIVTPDYVRPYAKSKMDRDGCIWTGWLERYGTRGMAITKWNTHTDEVELFEHLVPQVGIFGLDVTDHYVWFTTSCHSNGLAHKDLPLSLCAIDKDGNLVYRKTFPAGVLVGRLAFAGRFGVVHIGNELYRIDEEALSIEPIPGIRLEWSNVEHDHHIQTVIACSEDTVAVFDIDQTLFVKPETGELVQCIPSPKGSQKELFSHGVYCAAVLDGKLYASVGEDLYVLEKDE